VGDILFRRRSLTIFRFCFFSLFGWNIRFPAFQVRRTAIVGLLALFSVWRFLLRHSSCLVGFLFFLITFSNSLGILRLKGASAFMLDILLHWVASSLDSGFFFFKSFFAIAVTLDVVWL